ncbi:hypothetical protein [Streptomyces sp. NPDC058623]
MLAVDLRRRDAKESVTVARHLGTGRPTPYRTLAAYDEAMAATSTTAASA